MPSPHLPTLVAGLALTALGTLFLLDTADVLTLHLSAVWPLLLGALGAVVLAAGLAGRRG